jgi:hypothetical protein
MLEEVAGLLPDLDLRPLQGSWSGAVGASAGTHAGAGAIDLDARHLTIDERVRLATAMRQVGFAAWVRGPDGWAGGFDTWHVHGIAADAPGLSPAAAAQVEDYRAGRDGLARKGPDYHTRAYQHRTWEGYKQQAGGDDDMTPEQAKTLDEVHWMLGQMKPQTDQINPRLMKPVDDSYWLLSNSVIELLKEISGKLDRLLGQQ